MICPVGFRTSGVLSLDADYAVVLGQLGHPRALLLAELYGFHLLSSLVV